MPAPQELMVWPVLLTVSTVSTGIGVSRSGPYVLSLHTIRIIVQYQHSYEKI